MILKRFYHACNSFSVGNELILAVVGGTVTSAQTGADSNEFLVYNPENDFVDPNWSNLGATLDLPHTLNGCLLVSNGETLFFINTQGNAFWRLENTGGLDGYKWINMSQRLKTPRSYAVGVLIPDELASCNNTAIEIQVTEG